MNLTSANTSIFLPFLAVFITGLVFLAVLDAGFVTAGAVFEYASDAPYLHLAAAEEVTRNGLNAGPVLGSSSPLYTALLTPLSGDPMQRYLPLILNALGLILAVALWGSLIWHAGYGDGVLGIMLAVAGPLALSMVGLALYGLEFTLFLAISFAILIACLKVLDGQRISRSLLLLVVLAPLLRPEGIVLAVLACLMVLACKRYKGGLILLVVAIIPVLAQAYWKRAQGLDPVPEFASRMLEEIRSGMSDAPGVIARQTETLLTQPQAQLLLALIAVAGLLLLSRSVWQYRRWPLVIAMIVLGALGLLFLRFDVADHAAIALIAIVAAGTIAAAGAVPGRLARLVALGPVAFAGWINVPFLLGPAIEAPRAVILQQGQLARFAKDHLNAPVATDQSAYVAWANPHYVLDLPVAASDKTLTDQMIETRDIHVAMIRDSKDQSDIQANWKLLGQLKIADTENGATSLYLTGDYPETQYIQMLNQWKATLPKGAEFSFHGKPAP